MKTPLLIVFVLLMASCSTATLKKENEELRNQLEQVRLEAEQQRKIAVETAATARAAQEEAENQAQLAREAVEKALENCK